MRYEERKKIAELIQKQGIPSEESISIVNYLAFKKLNSDEILSKLDDIKVLYDHYTEENMDLKYTRQIIGYTITLNKSSSQVIKKDKVLKQRKYSEEKRGAMQSNSSRIYYLGTDSLEIILDIIDDFGMRELLTSNFSIFGKSVELTYAKCAYLQKKNYTPAMILEQLQSIDERFYRRFGLNKEKLLEDYPIKGTKYDYSNKKQLTLTSQEKEFLYKSFRTFNIDKTLADDLINKIIELSGIDKYEDIINRLDKIKTITAYFRKSHFDNQGINTIIAYTLKRASATQVIKIDNILKWAGYKVSERENIETSYLAIFKQEKADVENKVRFFKDEKLKESVAQNPKVLASKIEISYAGINFLKEKQVRLTDQVYYLTILDSRFKDKFHTTKKQLVKRYPLPEKYKKGD